MFIGDFEKSIPLSENGVKRCRKFLERVWRLQDIVTDGEDYSKELETNIHKTIKKVTEDYETLKFNTAIAALMALVNEFNDIGKITEADFKTFLILLNPVAPHITEELWEITDLGGMLHDQKWPQYDEDKTQDEVIEMPVQVNGKVRGKVIINVDDTQEMVREKAKENESIMKYLEGKQIIKEIFVIGKIYNIVVK